MAHLVGDGGQALGGHEAEALQFPHPLAVELGEEGLFFAAGRDSLDVAFGTVFLYNPIDPAKTQTDLH